VVSDWNGQNVSSEVSIVVNPVNDNPILTQEIWVTNEDTFVEVDITWNDTDVDGDSLIISSITSVTNWTWSINGAWTWIIFTPNSNFNWTWTVDYIISDWNGGNVVSTLNVIVNSINDNPVLNSEVWITNEDTSVEVDITSNDTDVDWDSLTISSIISSTNWTWSINGTSTWIKI